MSRFGNIALVLLRLGSATHRQQKAQTGIAQVESSPDQKSKVDREQDMGKERVARAHLAGHRAAQVGGEQQRAKNRRAGKDVEHSASQQEYADGTNGAGRVSERDGALDRHGKRQKLDRAVNTLTTD